MYGGPVLFSDIAISRHVEPVMSSGARSASLSSGSRLPKITRWITSSVIACIRGSALSGFPGTQVSSSSWASSEIVLVQRLSASPWNGGSICRRCLRCCSPFRIRIELRPTNGSRNAELSPPSSTSGGARYTRLISSGSLVRTSGASDHAVRSVNGSP